MLTNSVNKRTSSFQKDEGEMSDSYLESMDKPTSIYLVRYLYHPAGRLDNDPLPPHAPGRINFQMIFNSQIANINKQVKI